MEKSDSVELQGSGDEGGNQRDEQPTTSRTENSPELNSHNMSDFKSLDCNSADEVMQAMNAVLNGHQPPQSFTKEANQVRLKLRNKSEPIKITEVQNKANPHDLRKTVQRQIQQNLYVKMKSTADTNTRTRTKTGLKSSELERRGRPMKPGPSRTVKIAAIRKSVFYIGKLSNVVQFKRRCRWSSESGSDADSYIFY